MHLRRNLPETCFFSDRRRRLYIASLNGRFAGSLCIEFYALTVSSGEYARSGIDFYNGCWVLRAPILSGG